MWSTQNILEAIWVCVPKAKWKSSMRGIEGNMSRAKSRRGNTEFKKLCGKHNLWIMWINRHFYKAIITYKQSIVLKFVLIHFDASSFVFIHVSRYETTKVQAVLLLHWHSGNIYDDSLFLETTSYPRLTQEKMSSPVQILYNVPTTPKALFQVLGYQVQPFSNTEKQQLLWK